MKKLLISAAIAAGSLSANAGSMHGGDWADLISVVIGGVASAAQGYAAAQQQAQQQAAYEAQALANQPPPTVFYKGYYINGAGVKVCTYTDGSELAIASLSQCPAYF